MVTVSAISPWVEDRGGSWANTQIEKVMKSGISASVSHSRLSLQTHKQCTRTRTRTHTTEVLQQHCCIASTPQLDRMSRCHSLGLWSWLLFFIVYSSSGPLQLAEGATFWKKWWFTSRSVNYVVLTRLSSFLMAANRKKTEKNVNIFI